MKLPDLHKQAFIFDLDDTLYKEIDYVISAYRHIERLLVAEYDLEPGVAYDVLADSFDNNENPFDNLNAFLKSVGVEIPNAIEWMLDEYRNHIPLLILDGYTECTLSLLKEVEIPMFIITDGRSRTQRNKIRALGVDEFVPWSHVFISEEQGFDKTSPHSFEAIKKIIGKDADDYEYVFVGDNPAKDFVVANKFGATSIQLIDDGRNIHPQDILVDKSHKAKRKIKYLDELNMYLNGMYY